jgi:hypothetical protein
MNGKVEDITDIINDLKARYTPENFENMNITVGRTLTFNYEGSPVTLKITEITDDGRYLAEHIDLYEPTAVSSHIHHNVDATGEVPFCTDCEVPVTDPATPQGKAKFEARKERHLSDGTPIEDEPEEQ